MAPPQLPDSSDINLRALRKGKKIGTGGEGSVFELHGSHHAGLVLKLYHRPDVDGAALQGLVNLPEKLTAQDRSRLGEQTAWPLARVMDGTAVAGFVMQKIPDRFRARTSAGIKGREIQYLMFEPRPAWGEIAPPGIAGRIELAREIAGLIAFMHANTLVLGDISMKNMLWTYGPVATVFLIDCDGIRRLGRRPIQPQSETPDWGDPHRTQLKRDGFAVLDLDNDRYKCALTIGRVLSREAYVSPGQPLDLLPGVPDRVATGVQGLWRQAARPRGSRPDASMWLWALGSQ